MTQAQIIPYIRNDKIEAYDPFREKVEEWKKANATVTFDYESPKGNKEARSHIYQMRTLKAAVEKTRKAEKEESLERGRKVDAQAKEIVAEIEALIDVHQKPIDAIEQRELDRVAKIQAKIENMRIASFQIHDNGVLKSSAAISELLATVKAVALDESFAEFIGEAGQVKDEVVSLLESHIAARQKQEAEQAELERLRKEAVEREQKERDERLQKEAAERATREAQEKALLEKAEAERKVQEERLEAERRELKLRLEKEEAEKRALMAADMERVKIAREAAAVAAEAAKREANRQHQAKIHGDIIAALTPLGVNEDLAKAIITAIRKEEIPHVAISY